MALVGFEVFPDHHPFEAAEVNGLLQRAQALGASALLCTEKEAVKLHDRPGGMPIFYLEVEIAFIDETAPLTTLLDNLVTPVFSGP